MTIFHTIAIDAKLILSEAALAALRAVSAQPLVRISAEAETCREMPEVDALICGWSFNVDAALLARLPGLRYVGLRCTSLYRVAQDLLAARGIAYRTIHAYGDIGTVEFVMENLLYLFRDRQRSQTGQPSELHGKTLGLVGYGEVGKRVAKLALAFGMRVMVVSRRPITFAMQGDILQASLEETIRHANVLSFHTPAYQRILEPRHVDALPANAKLIFTTLGMPVDAGALMDHLRRHPAAVAILDQCALSTHEQVLHELPNLHIRAMHAARTHESIGRAEQELLAHLDTYLQMR